MARKKYTTMSFPTELVDAIKLIIKKSGFKSPTDYSTFKLRLAIKSDMAKMNGTDKAVIDRLRHMGYKVEQ